MDRLKRVFDISDVLSITHDKLVSTRHIDGVYDILNFITQDRLYTHQLPRANRVAKPWILTQYPVLAEVDSSTVTTENWREWLAVQRARFGGELEVEALPSGVWEHRDPVSEQISMVGKDRVIVVGGRSPETRKD